MRGATAVVPQDVAAPPMETAKTIDQLLCEKCPVIDCLDMTGVGSEGSFIMCENSCEPFSKPVLKSTAALHISRSYKNNSYCGSLNPKQCQHTLSFIDKKLALKSYFLLDNIPTCNAKYHNSIQFNL